MKVKILLGLFVAFMLLAGSTIAFANHTPNISEFSAVNNALADKGIQSNTIQLSTTTYDKDFVFQFYDQYYNNIPVYGGKVGFVLKNGKVIYENDNYYNNININTAEPFIGLNEAKDIASEAADGDIISSQLIIFPKDTYYFLAYEIVYPEKTIFVNAEKGGILGEISNIIYDDYVYGNVSGMIIPEKPTDTKVSRQFKNEYLNFTNGTTSTSATTNATGFYNVSISGTVTLNSSLQGPYVKVINAIQAAANHIVNVTSPTEHSWNWQVNDTSADYEESNVFYHINYIHDYFTSGNPFNITAMNYQMQATVEYSSNCNAAYSLSDNNTVFYKNTSSCGNPALWSDIIYHEYTHGVIHHIYSLGSTCADEGRAMDEGLADYFAGTNNNNSCMAENWLIGTPCLRDLNNTIKYNTKDGECHDDGRILSGALWDLRTLTNATFTDALAMRGIEAQTQNFTAYLNAILAIDDNDTNLSNGTPNIAKICQAFAINHGILSQYCAGYTTNPLALINAPINGTLTTRNALLQINGTAYEGSNKTFNQYKIEYKRTTDSNWTTANTSSIHVASGLLFSFNTSNLTRGLYNIQLTVNDSNGTSTDSTIIRVSDAAIYCDSSPCIANSSLVMSRDSIINTSEPNQPNTIDACLDGSGQETGGYMHDESLENVTITAVNGTFQPGQNVTVNIWGYCYEGVLLGHTIDYMKIIYSNSSNPNSLNWRIIGGFNCTTDGTFENFSTTFTLDNVEGNHSIRGVMQLIGITGNISATCGGGAYDDADDVVITVGAPAINITKPGNITYTTQTGIPLNYTAVDNVAVSSCWYSIDGNTTTVALSGCTNTTFNVAADGSHYVRVFSNDTSNRVGSATRFFAVDTTAPIIQSTSPADGASLSAGTTSKLITVTTNEQAICKYSTSDVAYGSMSAMDSTNSTTSSVTVSGLSNGGSYDYYFRCKDLYENTATSSYHLSFSVSSSSGGGGGSSGGSGGITLLGNITLAYNVLQELDLSIGGGSYGLNFLSESHTIRLSGIIGDSAELTISSNPIKVLLRTGETKAVDVNGDGQNDLELTLVSMAATSARFVIKLLTETNENLTAAPINHKTTASGQQGVETGETPAGPSPSDGQLRVIVLLIVVAVLLVIIMKRSPRQIRRSWELMEDD